MSEGTDSTVRVLAITSDDLTGRLCREILPQASGARAYLCETVCDLAQAASRLADARCDAVLLDLGQDTVVAGRLVQGARRLAGESAILGLTDRRDEAFTLEMFRQGVDECLVKDRINRETLVRTVSQAIARASYRCNGAVRGTAAGASPITAVPDQKDELKAFLDALPVGVIALEANGNTFYLNSRGSELLDETIALGVPYRELRRTSRLIARKSGEPYPYESTPLASALQGRSTMVDDLAVQRGDQEIPLVIWGAPIFGAGGQVQYAIAVFADVSEQIAIQEEATRLLSQVAHFDRRTLLNELVMSIAHDVNQPLATIATYSGHGAELVANQALDSNKVRDLFERINVQSKRAGEVIHRLRRMVRNTDPKRESCQINGLVREIVSLFETEARHQGSRIELELDPADCHVAVDVVLIQQVFANLLRNALQATKAADSGKSIYVRAASRNGEVIVEVEDFGIGIDPRDLPRIFDAHFTTKTGGLGLGLSVSRSIVEAHHGRLMVKGDDAGALFTVVLPQSRESTEPMQAS